MPDPDFSFKKEGSIVGKGEIFSYINDFGASIGKVTDGPPELYTASRCQESSG